MVDPVRVSVPIDKEVVQKLSAGDVVLLSGKIVTGRDRIHKFLAESRPPKSSIPFDLDGTVLYHCGPIVKKDENGNYGVVAAGPTTSIRVEMYESDVIRDYGLRGIIGKGGMGEKTREALASHNCVYFSAIGGAAVLIAEKIKRVVDVWKLDEFGSTEAMWLLEVEDLPVVVTIDSKGNSLHSEVERISRENLLKLWKN